jgi:hypothetical protein
MSTNDEAEATESKEEVVSTAQDDEQLRQDLKNSLANDTKTEAAETETAEKAETAEATETKESDATLTTEPAKDLDWYIKAYDNSTKEALRLKAELEKKVETPPAQEVTPPAADEVLTPEQLYIRGKISEETTAAFTAVSEKYPALKEKETYDRFVAEAKVVGTVIKDSQQRFPTPIELYEKTAIILGLTPDTSDAVGAALKDGAAQTRTATSTPPPAKQSRVTEEMIAMNLKAFPQKSRQEIIEELEPHIQ